RLNPSTHHRSSGDEVHTTTREHIALVTMFFNGITPLPAKNCQGNLPRLVGIDGIDLRGPASLVLLLRHVVQRCAAYQPEHGHDQRVSDRGVLSHESLFRLK